MLRLVALIRCLTLLYDTDGLLYNISLSSLDVLECRLDAFVSQIFVSIKYWPIMIVMKFGHFSNSKVMGTIPSSIWSPFESFHTCTNFFVQTSNLVFILMEHMAFIRKNSFPGLYELISNFGQNCFPRNMILLAEPYNSCTFSSSVSYDLLVLEFVEVLASCS